MWPLLILTSLTTTVTACKLYQHWERETKWKDAAAYCQLTGKPLLNIGCGNNPRFIGDLNVDLQATTILPNYQNIDINQPLPWTDNEFGAVTAFHILEHVDNPQATIRELHRIADKVYIAVPLPFDIHSYFHPNHKWIFTGGPEPLPINGAHNLISISTIGIGLGLLYLSR